MSALPPVVFETSKTPIASDETEIIAIADSPYILLLLRIFKRRIAAMITTGTVNFMGEIPSTVETARAPKDM